MRDINGALQDFAKAIEIYPQYAPAYLHRGLMRIAQNNKDAACVDLNKAVELGLKEAQFEVNKYCR
jgi:tetratricopeptide (TPR) repeat protein